MEGAVKGGSLFKNIGIFPNRVAYTGKGRGPKRVQGRDLIVPRQKKKEPETHHGQGLGSV